MAKTHWKKAFNSEYLSSADIEDKDIVLTIANVVLESVKGADGQSKTCNVAHFKEKSKPMILNVTNSKIVKKFAGSRYIDDWIDIPIQLYVDEKIKAFGDVVEGLRIRTQQPKMGKPELKKDSPKYNDAVKFLKDGGKLQQITAKYELSKEVFEALENETKTPQD